MTHSTHSALDILTDYINATTDQSEAMTKARTDAEELGLPAPDAATASLLSVLASTCGESRSAIVISPAACVSGLAVLSGLGKDGHVTCIDTEAEHQRLARQSFHAAGITTSQFRFLPSRPLEVMTRLAPNSYGFIYAEVAPADAETLVKEALPLLCPRGILIVADILLDGTIADPTRSDRDTAAARQLDDDLRNRDDIHLARIPLGAGMVLISKIA